VRHGDRICLSCAWFVALDMVESATREATSFLRRNQSFGLPTQGIGAATHLFAAMIPSRRLSPRLACATGPFQPRTPATWARVAASYRWCWSRWSSWRWIKR